MDAAVLQAYWTPGTSLIAYLMQEHGEGLWAALPAVADSLPLGIHGLATAIANGVPAADFALLLEAADVDPAATWLNGANLAKVAAIHRRPEILRLLTARGVDAVARPRWGYGTILDDIAARAEPESAADTEALTDVVRQLTAAGAQPDLPSTLRTLAERLPGVALPRLNPEAAALADSLGDVVAAFAALDADWMQKIDAADRLEQRCEAQLADFEGSAAAFQATDLAAKQRYQEVLRKRLERMWEEWQRKADEQRAAAADEAPADRRGEDELYDALLLATQDDQWQDAVALADQIGGNAHRILLEMALGSDAPLDVVLELVQRHGSLPESAMQTIGFRRGDAAIAEALEPFGLDVHYVDEEGHNAFTRLARNFMGTEHEWRLAEYLASRSVAVKPRPFGLDPLDRVLMDIVASPRVDSEAGVGFARFLIDHGAPVEASHLELAAQLFNKTGGGRMTALALTAPGRAAVADAAHVGTDAVELTHLAVGDGLRPAGTDDDARTALRNERDREAVLGRAAASGHIACVADWTPAASYAVTEIGLIADVDGDTVLLAYWAAESVAAAAVRASAGTRLLLACDIAVVSSAADIDLTLSPSVQFAAVEAATTAVAGISRRATGAEVAAAAAAVREADRAALAREPHVTPYEVARLVIALRGGALPAGRTTLKSITDAITTLEGKVVRRIATLWGGPNLYLTGANIAGAAVANNTTVSLPAGTFLFRVLWTTNHSLSVYGATHAYHLATEFMPDGLGGHWSEGEVVVVAAAADAYSIGSATSTLRQGPQASRARPAPYASAVKITIEQLE